MSFTPSSLGSFERVVLVVYFYDTRTCQCWSVLTLTLAGGWMLWLWQTPDFSSSATMKFTCPFHLFFIGWIALKCGTDISGAQKTLLIPWLFVVHRCKKFSLIKWNISASTWWIGIITTLLIDESSWLRQSPCLFPVALPCGRKFAVLIKTNFTTCAMTFSADTHVLLRMNNSDDPLTFH